MAQRNLIRWSQMEEMLATLKPFRQQAAMLFVSFTEDMSKILKVFDLASRGKCQS